MQHQSPLSLLDHDHNYTPKSQTYIAANTKLKFEKMNFEVATVEKNKLQFENVNSCSVPVNDNNALDTPQVG